MSNNNLPITILALALSTACEPAGARDVLVGSLLTCDDDSAEPDGDSENADDSSDPDVPEDDPPLLDLGTDEGEGELPSPPPAGCGNKELDPGEVCDFRLVGACTCEALGFDGGWLRCDDYCSGLEVEHCTGEAPAELDLSCLDGEAVPCIEHSDCKAFAGPCSLGVCTHTGCASQPYADGVECDDADACTWGSTCSAGECSGGVPIEGCEPIDPDPEPEQSACKFTQDWCLQAGTMEQYTRCEMVTDGGNTCISPEIRYGNTEGGIPRQHAGNDYSAWCQQLGFSTFLDVQIGPRSCNAPQGGLFWCVGYDEDGWHWCDWNDGVWHNQQLDHHDCDSTQILSITCSP